MMGSAAGVCRFCGCTDRDPCLDDDGFSVTACWWSSATLCSSCVPAALAEAKARPADATRAADLAFHRGFVVGWFDLHGNLRRCPYVDTGSQARVWTAGLAAGEARSRQYQLACGPLRNAPRRRGRTVGVGEEVASGGRLARRKRG
jgi:hypothetical protein